MKRPWILGSLLLVFTFAASVWSYRTSLNRIEVDPFIAVVRPASVTTNPFNLTGFTIEGKLRVYSSPSFPDDTVTYKFLYNNKTYQYDITGYQSSDTAFSVKPGDTVNMTVMGGAHVLYGWAAPTDQGVNQCPAKLQPYLTAAQAATMPIVSQQCWNDDNSGDDYYEDVAVLIAQIPGTAASPSPSPSPSSGASPSPSPTPNASPTGDQVQYQVRPFNDANRNGARDSGESAIQGAEFKYKIYINSDPPQDYTVSSGAEGKVVTSGKGTKLKVEQVDTPGWIRTTPQTVSIEMTESKLYTVDFGNYNPAVGGGSLNNTPTQPDTGTPTVLTVSLLAAAPLFYWLRKRYAQKR